MHKKGQLVSMDLAASVLVFVLMLAFLYYSWNTTSERWEQQRESLDLEEKAFQQSRLLVEYSGYPASWASGNVEIIGLANHPNVVSPDKLALFAALDYNVAREKMNILNYDFQVEIFSDNPALDQNIGVVPSSTSRVASVEHAVLIGENHAVLRFKLFR